MIVTLAGHVDHGKTSLVKALSGIETDSLKEEQRRGLTIDLGFAYINSGDCDIGFVDVPGHHKFIHNMVAGIAHTQFAMLVIAADDGPMPQTREHLSILGLMGLQHGIVVVSKVDKVSEQELDSCLENVRKLILGTFMEHSPIHPVSTYSGGGIPELLQLITVEAQKKQNKSDSLCFRMAVDRVFSIKGSGLVVTGTIHSGQVDINTQILASSTAKPLRVKGIYKQNQPASHAQAGDRCSLNLNGIEKHQIGRGDWILEQQTYAPSRSLVIRLKVLPEFPRAVKHWLPVHIYHATSHTTGKIALLDSAPLQPGDSALIELELDEALFAKRHDRIVIREFGAERTLGGGEVIDISASPYRRRDRRRLAYLQHLSRPRAAEALGLMLSSKDDAGSVFDLVNVSAFQQNWNLTLEQMHSLLTEHKAILLENASIIYAYAEEREHNTRTSIMDVLKEHHGDNPASPGMKPDSLRRLVPAPEMLTNSILIDLGKKEQIKISAGLVHLPTQAAILPVKVQTLFDAYKKLASRTNQPPSLGDVAKSINVVQTELARALKQAARVGLITEISANRFFLPDQLKKMINHVLDLTVDDASFSVRDYRDKTGIGRNTAIEVLEHFDARGFTKRFDNLRKRISTYK